jgi:hypothetical protein
MILQDLIPAQNPIYARKLSHVKGTVARDFLALVCSSNDSTYKGPTYRDYIKTISLFFAFAKLLVFAVVSKDTFLRYKVT